jgi:polysaccharide export outer membrane protein
LADVIQRAGGLTPDAFPEGAVFLREYLKEKEEEKIDTLTRRMETDIASMSLQADSGDGDSLQTAQVLLENLKNTEAVGRLVITLQNDVARSVGSIEVRDGDRLLIPTASQVVTVLGETQQNSSHLYQSGLSRDEYIDLSGGLTRRADKKLIYIVRANGALIIRKRRWFGRARGMKIRPGDTIVVPLETNPISPLSLWTSATQIFYQSAIGVAALNTFNRYR